MGSDPARLLKLKEGPFQTVAAPAHPATKGQTIITIAVDSVRIPRAICSNILLIGRLSALRVFPRKFFFAGTLPNQCTQNMVTLELRKLKSI